MYILGLSCFYHDSAAALLKDGKIVAAAQEERFTRKKQDSSFPTNAIKYCLAEAKISMNEVAKIVFYEDPKLKFRRILNTCVTMFPRSIPLASTVVPEWLTSKIHWKKNLIEEIRSKLDSDITEDKIDNTTHHRSHAASAFFPSQFQSAAVLVLDGVGEFATTSLWHGRGNNLELKFQINFPHSLGLLYSAFTYYTGFKVNSGEYKVMGLAPYGEPKYVDTILKNLISIEEDGSYKLDMRYFGFATSNCMTNDRFHALFGAPPREPESNLTQREMDLAASIQSVCETVMLKLASKAKLITGERNLCLAGGVALNCVGNGKILDAGIFEKIWIQPAAGDAGGALGAALSYHYEKLNSPREVDSEMDQMQGAYLGPAFTLMETQAILKTLGAKFHEISNEDLLLDTVANYLAQEKVVGWHSGRMEFGPRSLGARSILGDPRGETMQKNINLKIKFRESFRPFAPSVLREKIDEYFELEKESPYMLLVAPVKKEIRSKNSEKQNDLFGIEKLNVPRSTIPAVTHVDYSARVQSVDRAVNPRFHKLISKFEDKTGCGVVVNTSFNVRGEPIVCTPEDSYRCFMRTEMDALVIDNFLLLKEEQPKFEDSSDWRKEFQLD